MPTTTIHLTVVPLALIVMRRAGTSHDAVRARLAHAAGLIVDEDRCRFRSVRSGDTAPPVRQPVRAYVEGHDVSHASVGATSP